MPVARGNDEWHRFLHSSVLPGWDDRWYGHLSSRGKVEEEAVAGRGWRKKIFSCSGMWGAGAWAQADMSPNINGIVPTFKITIS